MKYLCVDQSTKVSGYSVWLDERLETYGTIASDPNEKNPIERMRQTYFHIKVLINKFNPDWLILENVQFQRNHKVYSQLSQLQGVIFSLTFERDIGLTIIESSAWKSAAGVSGKARNEQKASAIQIVKDAYGVEADEDEADAIGIGIWAVKNIKVIRR